MTITKRKIGIIISVVLFVIFLVGILFIISFSGKKQFSLDQGYSKGVKLEVTERETLTSPKSSSPNTNNKHMVYDIDLFSKISNEKVSSVKLEFDYSYSPEKNQTEIKNPTSEVINTLNPWQIRTNLNGITGKYTDLSSIDYFVSAHLDLNESASVPITITANQNGNTEMFLTHSINLDRDAADKYFDDFTRKSKAAKGHSNMLDTLYTNTHEYPLTPIENSNISYYVKEYQTEPFKIKASSSSTNEDVPDFYFKEAEHQIYLQTPDGKEIGSLVIPSTLLYSSSKNNATCLTGVGHRSSSEGWTFDCKLIGETGDSSALCATTSEVTIMKDDVLHSKLLITTTLDSDGTILLKPIYALPLE